MSKPKLKKGDRVKTASLRHVLVYGKRYPAVDRHLAIVVSVEPQGVLLNDDLYYPESELTHAPN